MFAMNWKKLIESSFKIITVMLVVSIVISMAFYYQLHSIIRSDPAYLQISSYLFISRISAILLFFTALLGVAYVMAIAAKRTVDKGIIRLHEHQELKPALEGDAP